MPDKEREIAGIPIGGFFVILALLLGYFAIPDQPFKTSRQSIPDAAQIQAPKSSHVDARLWEDPFVAVLRSEGYAVSGAEEYRLPRLAGRMAEKWTGNLVIASSFGLNLHPTLQKNVPPLQRQLPDGAFFRRTTGAGGRHGKRRHGLRRGCAGVAADF